MVWLAASLAVIVVGALTIVRERDYAAAQAAVHHTLDVRQSIADTLSLLKDAETAQRGYLITANPDFLAPHAKAKRAIPIELARLQRLVQSDAAQRASVVEMQRLAGQKLGELAKTIELAGAGRLEDARAMVRGGRGRRLMLALRAETDRMLAREAARLAEREGAAKLGRQGLTYALTAAWVVLLGVAAIGGWAARRGSLEARRANERLKQSEQALRALADNASDLVRVIGTDAEPLYVSPSCESILGYTQAEMLAMPPRALLPEEEREAAIQVTLRAREGEDSDEPFIHRLRVQGGSYRWFETKARLALNAPEGSGHVQLTSRDITDRKLAEEALRRQTGRLESILSSMGDGVVVLDEDRRVLVVNPVARDYVRQDEGERVPEEWAEQHGAYLPDGKTPFPSDQGPLTRALRGEACDGLELVFHDREGSVRAFSITSRPIRDGATPVGCVAVYRDITEQRRAEQALEESEQRLRVLSEASFEGVAITRAGIVLDTNENFASWLGRDSSALVGEPGISLFAPEDHAHVLEKSRQSDSLYEAHLLRSDGTRFPVEVRGRNATFRGQRVRIAVVRDITEKRRRETELKQQAELLRTMSLRDELTGLYNRRGFQEHAQQQLRAAVRTKRAACVFFIDLNDMKTINDTQGHETGDRALVATSQLLRGVFRESDIVARLGGDEFAVFAPECGDDHLPSVRGRLREHLGELNRSGAEPFRISISVGAAVFEAGSNADLAELMELADRRMYEDKRANKPGAAPARGDGSGRAPA